MSTTPPNADSGGRYDWVDDPDFQDWLNEIAENTPECCWDDDVAMTEIVRQYVRFLEAEVHRLGGNLHRDWCGGAYVPPIDSLGAP
jgi:hypothetical protein